MFKKLLLAVATLIATMGFAFAQVDVNKADAAALDSVKGIGPAKTKAIMEERKKGDFKDWADLEKRVKGIGEKNAVKLSQAGLVVNGKPLDGAPAATAPAAKADKATDKAAAKADKAAAKAAKADKADKAAAPAK
ncbi:DNA uptake protein [Duganella sp. BJB488]|uniref:ComEA family DNA-binding protein n=1 Tax=unclassified Duganella TaxID=2636909 RepID=UPI000E3531D1|nr:MULTISPECIES: helix-hairpin-helix domain-containing protein [unclassified Duganella]RFP12469.1 DNA uptake protein [Duganella sp. BJB489]RFP16441.1 DNA uptake protein [Duganella sp. BJB488]RFP30833.1 DNA uptake protein [Duganella sp. BJB480]